MTYLTTRRIAAAVLTMVAMGGGFFYWQHLKSDAMPEGFAYGNGRLEATEVDVATKVAGRLSDLGPKEGDAVKAGQVVGKIDAMELESQLKAAQAQAVQAHHSIESARQHEHVTEHQLTLARATLARVEQLSKQGFVSSQKLDEVKVNLRSAIAARKAARSQVAESKAATSAAEARVASLQATLEETRLKSPVDGRVLYRLAEPGEVLAPGGKVLTLIDGDDFYMTVFLPADEAGRLVIGSQARLVLDALPEEEIPATVSFVSPRNQFTPKEVETRNEREKLMFRVKVRVTGNWLASHRNQAKPGMPGIAWVRLDSQLPWPALPKR